MQRLRILIVDDDPDIGGFIKFKLSKDAPHFSITHVESGQDCLDYLDQSEVDCILSDYQLPGMNGMELLMELRARGSGIPLIFITGQGNEEVAREAFKAGAYDYFTKDIGFAHFTRIKNSIEQAVRNRESEDGRRSAEAALRDEKNKLEAILACMGDGVSIQDMSFKILYQNPAQKKLVGDHVGRYCYQAYESRDAVCEGCPVAMTFLDGMPHTAERSVVTDGGPLHVEITASPLRDSSGKVVAGIETVRDITLRRLAERRVDHLNRLYSVISHTNKAILRTTSRIKLMEEACRIAVEQGLFRMAWVGFADRATGAVRPVASWGTVEGYLDEIRVSTGDEPEGRGPVGRAIRDGAPFVVNDIENDPAMAPWRESAMRRGYRSLAGFPITTGEGVIGAFAVYSCEPGMFDEEETSLMEGLAADISFALRSLEKDEKRHIAEEAMRESEEKARTIADTVMDAIVMIDTRGRISYWNPAAERIFGYSADEALGRDLHELILPERYRQMFERRKDQGFPVAIPAGGQTREFSAVGKGIEEFPVEVSLSSVKIKGEWNHVGVVRDITDRKHSEDEKNALFHMLTHDIKGPLSIIYGYCDMVGQSAGRDAREMTDEIQEAARRISALIDDMLALSRLESKEAGLVIGPVSVVQLLRQAMRDNEALAAEKGVSMALEADPALPRVNADSIQLMRAFSNLVANAVHYNGPGGKVSLKAAARGDGGRIVVEVIDDGEGIVQEDMPHIFDKYYRGKRSGKKRGTGLGLAIVKAAVDAHGGSVSAESVKGKGSTFTVTLPVKK